LYEVSKLDRIISAQLINLGGGKEERGELILRSTVNLVTYRFLEESEMQKPEKKGKKGKKRK
jgi:Tfp pilus assembly protein PilO